MGMTFGDPLVALMVAVKQLLHLSAKKLQLMAVNPPSRERGIIAYCLYNYDQLIPPQRLPPAEAVQQTCCVCMYMNECVSVSHRAIFITIIIAKM